LETITEQTDAFKRMADEITFQSVVGSAGKWAAIRLQDGGSDHVAYDSRSDAVSHQLNPEYCTYILVPPGGMEPREAIAVLSFWRQAYDAGFRAVDPRDDIPSMPLRATEAQEQIRLLGGK
jgi:hypothetical protein